MPSARYRGHPFEDLIEAETTGEKTQFIVQYPRAGALAGVLVNGAFRPRWWFEVEMTMEDRGGAVAGQP